MPLASDWVNTEIFEDRDNAEIRITFQVHWQRLADAVFELANIPVKPKVFLVSVWQPGETRWDNQPYALLESAFCPLPKKAIYEAVEEVTTDQSMLFDVDQIINTFKSFVVPNMPGRTPYCNLAVGHEYLHILCVHLSDTFVLDQPRLGNQSGQSLSLLDTIVAELLYVGINGLGSHYPAQDVDWFDITPHEVLRWAGTRLLNAATTSVWGGIALPGLFEEIDAVSAKRYEGAIGHGRMLITNGHPLTITFDPSILITKANSRKIRKILEMSGSSPEVSLVAECGELKGLTHSNRIEDANTQLAIAFTGPHIWELQYGRHTTMRVADGHVTWPHPRILPDDFYDLITKLFFSPCGNQEAAEKLWELVTVAMKQVHGTMLVISDDAEQEANRLSGQSIKVHPRALQPEDMLAVTAIDGAVILSPDCTCHAVGVILDGIARPREGDSSRGARFNSATRYVRSNRRSKRLAVVISEDGMVNLIHNF